MTLEQHSAKLEHVRKLARERQRKHRSQATNKRLMIDVMVPKKHHGFLKQNIMTFIKSFLAGV